MADTDFKKRKTLSLKLDLNKTSSHTGKFEVEVRRKKRRGLILDNDKPTRGSSSQKLTDQEFKTRIKVLQEAMKQQNLQNNSEEPRQNSVSSEAPIQESRTEKPVDTESEFRPTDISPAPEAAIKKANKPFIAKPLGFKSERQGPIVYKASEPRTTRNPNIFRKTDKNNERRQYDSTKKYTSSKPVIFRSGEFKPKQNLTQRPTTSAKPGQQQFRPTRPIRATIAPEIATENIPVPNKQNTKSNFKPKAEKKKQNKKFSMDKRSESGRVNRADLERAMNDESIERARSMASIKRARLKQKNAEKDSSEVKKVIRDVLIPDTITVGELAMRMAVRAPEIIKYLMSVGTIATVNQSIDGETAEIVCTAFGHIPKRVSDNDIENDLNFDEIDKTANLLPRAPIVAVMGHVDHGKTTLLDTLRKASVAQKEVGGITQHVAAYQIEAPSGKKITFIDTPGHAAFSNIRARGATLTDIIVLVVAADDGIKEQTIEVIKQAKTQNVPIVVAINKIDKPDINVNKVKNELMSQEILLEEFGGEVLSVEISAKQNINLDKLLETILLQAEVLDLKANNNRAANGTILEVRIEKGRGIVASVIIQGGTLKNGDVFVAGTSYGKVRALYDSNNLKLNNVVPATPVELIGFDTAPEPGDTLVVVESEQNAKEIAEHRKNNKKSNKKIIVKSINQMISQSNIKTLNIFIKADVYGSLEAIEASLNLINHPEVAVKIIGKDIGVISESDIDFARSSDATVIGFNVNTTAAAKNNAKLHGIKILNHNVIYHLTEEIKSIMSSMLPPIIEEEYTGTADVKKLFVISRLGTVAGCYVSDGIIKKNNSKIKVVRGSKVLFEGKIKSMKHEKDEIKEAKQNHECGILADGFNDYNEGDKIECYEIISKERKID